MRKLIFLLLTCSSLFSSSFYELDPLVSVEGIVHVPSGELHLQRADPLTENIDLQRVYRDEAWSFFPQTRLTLYGKPVPKKVSKSKKKKKKKKKSKKKKKKEHVTYVYDLVKVADPNGCLLTYNLGGNGRYHIELPKGFTNTAQNEMEGNLKNQILEQSDPSTFTMTCPNGTKRIYRKANAIGHDLLFLLQSEQLPNGQIRMFEYDPQNRVHAIRCGSESCAFQYFSNFSFDITTSSQKTFQCRAKNNLLDSVEGDGVLEKYEYVGNRLQKICNQDGQTFLVAYNKNKVESIKNDAGDSLYTFSYFPNQTEVINSNNEKTIYSYTANFLPEKIEKSSPKETIHLQWDSFGNLLSKQIDADNRFFFTYGDTGILEYVVIDNGGNSSYPREISIIGGPKWPAAVIEKNGDTLLRKTTYSYQPIGVIEKVFNPDGTLCCCHTIPKTAVKRPWEESVRIGLFIEEDFEVERDFSGRMIAKRKWDENGDLLFEEIWQYDAQNLLSYTDPEGLVTRYEYNEAGQKEKELISTSQGDIETLFFYDEMGRLKEIQIENLRTIFEYDQEDQIIERREEDLKGNLITKISSGYVENSPTVEEALPEDEDLPGVHRSYDPLDRLIELYTDDETVHYSIEYNKRGQPTRVIDHVHNCEGSRTYDELGNLTQEIFLNGQTLQGTSDLRGRRTALFLPDNSSISYRWGPKFLDEIYRNASQGKYDYCQRFMEYDLAGFPTKQRLIDSFGEISYSLNDNRCVAEIHSRHFDQNTETITESHFQTPDKSYTYTCDGLGRIIEIQQQKRIVFFTYDVWDRQMTKRAVELVDNEWKETLNWAFLYDGDKEIGAYDLQENWLRQLRVCAPHPINPGDQAIAYELEGLPYAPIHDLYGNVHMLLSVIREKVMETYDFSFDGRDRIHDIWGDLLTVSKAKNPWRFGCYRIDEETGLLFIDGNFYDPSNNSFLTQPERKLAQPRLYQIPVTPALKGGE